MVSGRRGLVVVGLFPYQKSLDEFDLSSATSVNKPLLLELMRGDYLDGRENILPVGGSGSGKTHEI
ncbi:ATP-binding protein [Roseiconus lacunae]|uniref:ATP-binding protein n=1 Tax=Roseiconus lacunae TaxID=2605694 RepID=UPI003F538DDC